MGSRRSIVGLAVAATSVFLAGCSAAPRDQTSPSALGDNAITVASFDFTESTLLAEIYSQAIEAGGVHVRRAFDLGPREFVAPALARGLVEFVPEYAGSASQFLSLGAESAGSDVDAAHNVLVRTLRDHPLRALAPAPAQDVNAFVVTRATADRYGIHRLSDAAKLGRKLTFGGPPECSTRQFCLVGLERVYGLKFKDVVALDVGGPLTRQALTAGSVDVALLFTTDPAIPANGFVVLTDDKNLQQAENITPIVRKEVLERWPQVEDLVDKVSAHLTTVGLRDLNAEVAKSGKSIAAIAATWLKGNAP